MNLAEPLLARAELKTGAAGFALLLFVFGVGSTLGALRGRADGWAMLATLAGGGLALLASAFVPSVRLAAVTFFATGCAAGSSCPPSISSSPASLRRRRSAASSA